MAGSPGGKTKERMIEVKANGQEEVSCAETRGGEYKTKVSEEKADSRNTEDCLRAVGMQDRQRGSQKAETGSQLGLAK